MAFSSDESFIHTPNHNKTKFEVRFLYLELQIHGSQFALWGRIYPRVADQGDFTWQ